MVVRKTPCAEQPVGYICCSSHHHIICHKSYMNAHWHFLISKFEPISLSWCSFAMEKWYRCYIHIIVEIPTKASAGISWSHSLYQGLISPVTKDTAGKKNLWPFLGNPKWPVSKVLLCSITNYWIFFWTAWVLRVRFSLVPPVIEMHPEDICFESSIYFVHYLKRK